MKLTASALSWRSIDMEGLHSVRPSIIKCRSVHSLLALGLHMQCTYARRGRRKHASVHACRLSVHLPAVHASSVLTYISTYSVFLGAKRQQEEGARESAAVNQPMHACMHACEHMQTMQATG